MTAVVTLLNLFLIITGLATLVRYFVWKLTDYSEEECHYIVLLRDQNAEMLLRGVIEKSKYNSVYKNRRIYAVDMGVDEQTADVCKLMSLDYSQIIYCMPEELQKLL